MKKIILKNKKVFFYTCLVIILTFSFLLRLAALSYPYNRNESRRDYIVAHHIVKYHEFPLVGPVNAFTGDKNSPLYFYIIASILSLKNNFFFLSIINILLQLITACFIFELAKRLFETKTAILSFLLFNFNLFSLHQSAYIWLPWVMQPFVNLSYLLLLFSFIKRSYFFLLSAVFVFIFAGTIHNSAFALLPLFLILSAIIMKNQKAKIIHFLGFLLFSALTFLTFYISLLFYYFNNNSTPSISLSRLHIDTPIQIILNFMNNIPYFIGVGLFDSTANTTFIKFITFAVCALLIYYYSNIKDRNEKIFSWLILSSIGILIFCSSAINLKGLSIISHYLTPVFGIFIILVSRVCVLIFSKNYFHKLIGLFLLSLYTAVFLSYSYISFNRYYNFSTYRTNEFLPAESIRNEILTLNKKHGYKKFNFFNIYTYTKDSKTPNYLPTILSILENDLDTKLIHVDDNSPLGFKLIGNQTADYVFLICFKRSIDLKKQNDCLNQFLNKNKHFEYSKKIFADNNHEIILLKSRH